MLINKKIKGVAILEIFVLIASIFAFAYLLGNEFGLVSANSGNNQGNVCTQGGGTCVSPAQGFSAQVFCDNILHGSADSSIPGCTSGQICCSSCHDAKGNPVSCSSTGGTSSSSTGNACTNAGGTCQASASSCNYGQLGNGMDNYATACVNASYGASAACCKPISTSTTIPCTGTCTTQSACTGTFAFQNNCPGDEGCCTITPSAPSCIQEGESCNQVALSNGVNACCPGLACNGNNVCATTTSTGPTIPGPTIINTNTGGETEVPTFLGFFNYFIPKQNNTHLNASGDVVKNTLDPTLGYLGNALVVAFAFYGLGKLVGGIVGLTASQSNYLGLALGTGYIAGASIALIGQGAAAPILGTVNLPIIGEASVLGLLFVPVAAAVWAQLTPQDSYDAVTYYCNQWEAPNGGIDCNQCNLGPLPCTEYKCQSLGQSCLLVNQGTTNQLCVWNDRNDISPPDISPWQTPLTTGDEYSNVNSIFTPSEGTMIKNTITADGCIPPFSALNFGVSLDKPGQCKYDINRTNDYGSMQYVMDSGQFLYNHSLIAYFGGINAPENGIGNGINFPNGGNYTIYVRCQSSNGYNSTGAFGFQFCVDDEPDTTAPQIMTTDPINNMPVAFNESSDKVNVYVNKPSTCKWSQEDMDFDSMSGNMTPCTTSTIYNAEMLYSCSANLTGIQNGNPDYSNNYYFRCMSYPSPYSDSKHIPTAMAQSYNYTLIGTQPLVIDSVTPNGTTITNATNPIEVTLQAQTSAGYQSGASQCSFEDTSAANPIYITFFSDANSYANYAHSQNLYLGEGNYSYSIQCCDLGGNCDTKLSNFQVNIVNTPPLIVRIYNENNQLDIATDINSSCVYDTSDTTGCNYAFGDGLNFTSTDNLNHYITWNTASNFYIKCMDSFGNQPAPNACSVIVRPFADYSVTNSTQ